MHWEQSRLEPLFHKLDGHAVFENQKFQMTKEIAEFSEQKLLGVSIEDLVNYLVYKYQVNVPLLDVENALAEQREAQVEVSRFDYAFDGEAVRRIPGAVVTLEIPFIGDVEMFRVRPSSFNLNPPRAEIRNNLIVISVSGANLDQNQVQLSFDSAIKDINEYLSWQNADAKKLNDSLPGLARDQIEQRKQKLLANQNLVSGLKFKLKERDGASKTFVAPLKRKQIEPKLSQASTKPFVPEPILPDEDYSNILKIIEDMTMVMERSPGAFSTMGEEDIRQHFLVQLNGQYEGKATGETFNAEGKTDILVRHDGKNIFIAECKFWQGEKVFRETIDQLLSYLSWRDTKTAILIFNKNRDFSNVLEKIKEVSPQHRLYKSGPKIEGETRFRFVFGQNSDPNREVVITIIVFDIPQPDGKSYVEPRIRIV